MSEDEIVDTFSVTASMSLARLESLAEDGGICVSRGVRDHLRNRANFVFEELGEQLVKNIAQPVRAFRIRLGETQGDAAIS